MISSVPVRNEVRLRQMLVGVYACAIRKGSLCEGVMRLVLTGVVVCAGRGGEILVCHGENKGEG